MDLRPALQIQTVIKTLTDVILPALDPNNKLAQEQARLSIGMLQMALQRQSLMFRYDKDELTRSLALATKLCSQAKNLPGATRALKALAAGAKSGAKVRERARAEPSELEAANFDMREKIGALVTAAYPRADKAKLKKISAAVMANSKEQLLRERSWLIAQGWEPNPKSIPAIEKLLRAST
jgi:hypothetical protein